MVYGINTHFYMLFILFKLVCYIHIFITHTCIYYINMSL